MSNKLELLRVKTRLAAELAATTNLQPIRARLFRETGLENLLPELLHAAIEVCGADFGNIQVANPANGALRIAVQSGFRPEFLFYFKEVRSADSACGSARERGARVIVEDVAADPIFAGSQAREVMLQAECRAVQSTPLRGGSGKVLGMLSTHYRTSRRPTGSQLQALDVVAEQASQVLEAAQVEPVLLSMQERVFSEPSAATFAHEINNPLQALTNVIALLSENAGSNEAQALIAIARQELRRVISASQRLLNAEALGDPAPAPPCNRRSRRN